MKPNGPLAKWMRAAKPGKCPGSGKLKGCLGKVSGRRKLCGSSPCRKEYDRLYGLERRQATSLRKVVSVATSADSTRRVVISLECGHTLEVPRCLGERRQARRTCPTCAKKR